MESGLNGRLHRLAGCDLLADTGEDDNVGIHGHTDGQNNTSNTRQGQSHLKNVQKYQYNTYIGSKRNTCSQTHDTVQNDHQNNYNSKSDSACYKAGGDCFATKFCTYHVGPQLLKFQGQRTDTDSGCKLIGLLVCKVTGDLASSVSNCILDSRSTDHAAIIDNCDLISNICRSCLSKFLCTFIRQYQFYHILTILIAVCGGACLSLGHISSFQYYFTIGSLELQRTWLTKLCKNRICISNTRNLDIDPVSTFLINLSLGTVVFHTLLQLVDRVCHIFCTWFFIADCLVGDAHTACQIQTQMDLICRTQSVCSPACC